MMKRFPPRILGAAALLGAWAAAAPALAADAAAQVVEPAPPSRPAPGTAPALELTAAPAQPAGELDLLLRTYVESLQILGGTRIHAAVQSARLVYRSAWYGGDLSAGIDAGLYGAVRLEGSRNSRNMSHYRPDGSGPGDPAWGYLGEYALKLRYAGTVLKYGLQPAPDNPFTSPYDIRSLPPTFRGVSVVSTDVRGTTLAAGSFSGAVPRGDDRVRGLSTSYGGIGFDRISYAGAETTLGTAAVALYAGQARDLWNQYYLSVSQGVPVGAGVTLTGRADSYITRASGRRRQGEIDNRALGVSLVAQKGPHAVLLGYQHIDSDQFFDYTQETAGIFLANAMGVDYNSPHERSYQLRYTFDGNRAGVPGWKIMAWTVRGEEVDGRQGALAHADPADPLNSLYVKSAQYVRGKRYEWGIKNSYVVQKGPLKDLRIAFYVYRTRVGPLYPSKSFNDAQLMINFPVRIF